MTGIDAIVAAVANAAAEQVAARLVGQMGPLVRAAVRAALDEASADAMIDTGALAELLGCPTTTAAKRRVDRDSELRALAVTGGGGRRWTWRRSEVLALLARRRAERKGGAR